MKNFNITIISLAIILGLTSCNDEFLTVLPEDQITEDGFYANADQIRSATAGIYGNAWFNANDKFLFLAGDCMPGDLLYQDGGVEGQFYYMTFNENNTEVLLGWQGLYRVVGASNAVINNMPSIASGHGVSQDIIDKGLAEARFLRGTAYFFLTEFWGDIPLVENTAALLNSNNIQIPKNTRKSVYEFIRRDLEFAAQTLPLSDDPGRVTTWSAKGMLAKLHLTMASDLSDPNSGANFTKAKEYAADVMDNSGLELQANYADLFTLAGKNNPESLFALQFTNGGYGIGSARQTNFIRSQNLGGGQGWGGGKGATYGFIENLVANAQGATDERRKEIYMQLGDYYPNIHKSSGGYTYNIHKVYPDDYVDASLAGTTENAGAVLNHIKKYVLGNAEDIGVASIANQDVPINQYVLRLADVYLIYAEATIGAGSSTNDAKAIEFYNKVRTRAGLQPRENTITYEQVFNERRVEFGIEGINWFDVKRRFYRNPDEAISHLNAGKRAHTFNLIDQGADDATRNTYAAYLLTEPSSPVIVTPDKMYLPIPVVEITANPKLAPTEESVDYVFEN